MTQGEFEFYDYDDDSDGRGTSGPAQTSADAMGSILPVVETLRKRALKYIQGRGEEGATDDEGHMALRMKADTYRPRRVELYHMGLVNDSGRTRSTVSERDAVVWVACEFGGTPYGKPTDDQLLAAFAWADVPPPLLPLALAFHSVAQLILVTTPAGEDRINALIALVAARGLAMLAAGVKS